MGSPYPPVQVGLGPIYKALKPLEPSGSVWGQLVPYIALYASLEKSTDSRWQFISANPVAAPAGVIAGTIITIQEDGFYDLWFDASTFSALAAGRNLAIDVDTETQGIHIFEMVAVLGVAIGSQWSRALSGIFLRKNYTIYYRAVNPYAAGETITLSVVARQLYQS